MFSGIKLLGQGHFGSVLLARFENNILNEGESFGLKVNKLYALKIIKIPHNLK